MSPASRGLAPHEGLECLLVKMGRTRPLEEPHRGLQAGKSGDPRSQNADREIMDHINVPEKWRMQVEHAACLEKLGELNVQEVLE